ncbi:MAG: hypothetical protein ISR58_19935 [Anaerolineales bacterium]|nr:hypothetical protein [Chloroflexota bacterium]MBL6983456.1 hypothetical protein [Anaerolineales bacterium]
MEEIKVKFSIQNYELIRQGLGGVYFLMQGEDVVFIGENKDISRQIVKHVKKKTKFDAIGVTPVEDNKQRRLLAQMLINKYRPRFNKISGRKAAAPPKQKPRQEKSGQKRKPRGTPSKEISVPQNRMDMIRPGNQNGSVQLSEPSTEMVQWLAEQGLGTRGEIVQQAIMRYYQERKDSGQDGLPDQDAHDTDQAENKDNGIISDSARDALIAWTHKLNQEAYSEMSADEVETQSKTKEDVQQAVNSAYVEKAKQSNQSDERSDLPEWLTNLADETLFGDIIIEQTNVEGGNHQESPQPAPDATLPDWAISSSQASQKSVANASSSHQEEVDWKAGSAAASKNTPTEANVNLADDEDDIPEWMSDIDMKKSGGNSVSPFG